MSSPVSNTAKAFFNAEFEEEIKSTMKEEALATLEKTSSQLKIVLKGQTDVCVEISVPILTSSVTSPVEAVSSAPVASIVNKSVNTCAETASKKVCHKIVDECVDKTAKKAIDEAVDKSIVSTKSYYSMAYDYFQGKSA